MSAFAPLGDSSRVTISDAASVRTAIGSLPANGVLRIIPLNPNQTAFYIKLGDNTVVAARNDSMKVDQASLEAPIIVPVYNSQTHIAILAEGGSGDVLITRGAEIGGNFAPLGAGSQSAITETDQTIALPTLGTRSPAIRVHALSGNMSALWVKLGNGSVTGSTTTSMKIRPGSKEDPTIIGVTASETHLSIFCEGQPGNVQIMGGDAKAPDGAGNVAGPASATDGAVALFNGTSGKLLKNSAITVDSNGNATVNITGGGALTVRGTGNIGFEVGRTDGTGSLTFIDMHTGATVVDYDVRLLASGGSGASGGGTLNIAAATLQHNGVSLLKTGDATPLWTYATEVNTTSGTALTLASGLPSTVREIEIMFRGVVTNAANADLVIRLGDSGGFETSGYLSIAESSGSVSILTSGFAIVAATLYDAGNTVDGVIRVVCYDNDNTDWNSTGVLGGRDRNTSHTSSGSKTLSAALTQVQLTTHTGTAVFSAGTVSLRYR